MLRRRLAFAAMLLLMPPLPDDFAYVFRYAAGSVIFHFPAFATPPGCRHADDIFRHAADIAAAALFCCRLLPRC